LTTLILKGNKLLTPEAGKVLSDMLAANTVLKELDISGNGWEEGGWTKGDGPGFAKELAVGISGNGAISSINLLKNRIPVEQAQELVQIMRAKEKLATLCGLSKEETELDFSDQDLRAGDAVLIANDISDMRALTALDISNNSIGQLELPAGWSTKYIPSHTCNDKYEHTDGRKQASAPEGAHAKGVIALANAIPDMRAISSVNLLKNRIDNDQAKDLVSMLKEHPTLKSLCGNRGNETELEMSGKMDGAGDAVMLAAEVIDNGALTSLDISENALPAEGTKLLAEALKSNQIMTALNISSNDMTYDGVNYGDMSGVAALADAMPGMGAMTSLNLASNKLGVEGAKIIAACLPKCT
jgi:Ran GTPase-activating protein (RanGAP) involved in mRNA processing and transport